MRHSARDPGTNSPLPTLSVAWLAIRTVSTFLTVAILAPTALDGRPQAQDFHREYAEWTISGREDPMDGWQYVVSNTVSALRPLPFPYDNAVLVLSVIWLCSDEDQGAFVMMKNAPRIGNLPRRDPPISWYLEKILRESRSPSTPEKRLAEQRALETLVLVRVRWDDKPPTELGGILGSDHSLLLFKDPFAAAYGYVDDTALSKFVTDLSDHSTLLVEISWADRRLSKSHFRVPLDGAAEALEDAGRRCPDPHER